MLSLARCDRVAKTPRMQTFRSLKGFVLWPFNKPDSHWALLAVDNEGECYWLDSLNNSPDSKVTYYASLVLQKRGFNKPLNELIVKRIKQPLQTDGT